MLRATTSSLVFCDLLVVQLDVLHGLAKTAPCLAWYWPPCMHCDCNGLGNGFSTRFTPNYTIASKAVCKPCIDCQTLSGPTTAHDEGSRKVGDFAQTEHVPIRLGSESSVQQAAHRGACSHAEEEIWKLSLVFRLVE